MCVWGLVVVGVDFAILIYMLFTLKSIINSNKSATIHSLSSYILTSYLKILKCIESNIHVQHIELLIYATEPLGKYKSYSERSGLYRQGVNRKFGLVAD